MRHLRILWVAFFCCQALSVYGQTLSESFNGSSLAQLISSGWVDLSTNPNHIMEVRNIDGRDVLFFQASPPNQYDLDAAIEYRGLNPNLSRVWSVEFLARDDTSLTVTGAHWVVGVGEKEYWDPIGTTATQLGVFGCDCVFSDYQVQINKIGQGYDRYYGSAFPRDNNFHLFSITSDGVDLRYYIDGTVVWIEANAAFAATRVFMGIGNAAAQGTLLVDSVRFTTFNGLMGYWKLNDNPLDSSGNQHDGQLLFGSGSYQAFEGGKINSALNSSGRAYVEVADSPSLSGLGDLTMEAWVYLKNYSVPDVTGYYTRESPIVNKWGPGLHEDDEYRFSISPNGTVIAVFTGPAAGSDLVIRSTQVVPLNEWTHLAAVLDTAAGMGRLYINGVLTDSIATAVVASHDTGMPLRIGMIHQDDGGPLWFEGLIDEVRIWNTARTQDQIMQNMYVEIPSSNSAPSARICPLSSTLLAGSTCTASAQLDGGCSSDPDNDQLTFSWTGSFGTASGPTPTVSLPLGNQSITLTVNDGRGGTATDTVEVKVLDDTKPTMTVFPTSETIPTDSTCHTTLVDLTTKVGATDNCTPSTEIRKSQAPIAGTLMSLGTQYVTLTAQDGAGNSVDKQITVQVLNSPPSASISGITSVREGETVRLSGQGSDPEGGTNIYAWDLDGDGVFETAGQNASFAAINGNAEKRVSLKVADTCSLISVAQASVTIMNVPPTVGVITAPAFPVAVTDTVNSEASFTDPGVLDTHTATWNWGDGTATSGVVTESNGSGSVTGSHLYAAAGVYRIVLTVADKEGGSAQSFFEYVVIFDPAAGFVTGAGWIDSSPGAYTPDPALSGKATFGFVSKYHKGAGVPTGNTQFKFHVADMDFKSTSYEWMVISGAKAKYKGEGTLSGTGTFGFMVTAIDGRQDGGGQDKFRIKIWDKASGTVVYDNQAGASDDSDNATAISGGRIVIQN